MPVLRQFSVLQQREIVTLGEVKYWSVMGVHSWKTKLKIWRLSLKVILILHVRYFFLDLVFHIAFRKNRHNSKDTGSVFILSWNINPVWYSPLLSVHKDCCKCPLDIFETFTTLTYEYSNYKRVNYQILLTVITYL